jgi:REP element-mobilizing transposase RayT
MSHTYCQLLYHLVWSTKNRSPSIPSSFEERLHCYIGGAFKTKQCLPLQIGGMPDHVHVLVSIPPTILLSEIVRNVKVCTTKWMQQTDLINENFSWQEGYGAFSVSASNREGVTNYIQQQKEHHKKHNFKEEFLMLLGKHGIAFDEKYLWK